MKQPTSKNRFFFFVYVSLKSLKVYEVMESMLQFSPMPLYSVRETQMQNRDKRACCSEVNKSRVQP